MNIIVTGASKGIGEALVKLFAKAGNNRIVAIARSKDKLFKLKDDCEKKYPNAEIIPLPFDFETPELLRTQVIDFLNRNLESLDILINNAGYLKNVSFKDLTYEETLKHYKINVFSPIELIKGCVDLLSVSSMKHIVNIGTMGGINRTEKYSGMTAYSSAKGALAILSEILPKELNSSGIHVNYLALGAVNTRMFREAFPDDKATLKPGEMAEYIADFAIEGWKYFNGQIIPVSLKN
jgi:short-subunit dehydrogenase